MYHLYRLLSWRYYHRPIFVIDTGRSGTTVLLEALGAHPNLLAAWGEAPLVRDFGRLAQEFTADDTNGVYLRATNHLSDRRYLSTLRRLAFETTFGRDGGLYMRCRATAERLVKYRKSPLRLRMISHWCAKTFPDVESFDGLQALYPQARFLWIVRNGLDVVHSRTRFKGFKSIDFAKQCRTWADSIETYSWVAETDRPLELRHEHLLSDPNAFFTRVHEFLTLRQHPGPANFAKSTLIHPLDQKTQPGTDVKRALEQREAGWTQWNDDQIQTFRETCGQAMETLGYPMPC
jgi:hypothetical protein